MIIVIMVNDGMSDGMSDGIPWLFLMVEDGRRWLSPAGSAGSSGRLLKQNDADFIRFSSAPYREQSTASDDSGVPRE